MVLTLCGSMHFAQAQIDMPQASPKAKLETKVGLTDVAVEYSRPGLKGRGEKVFGQLLPYGQVWRTGANESTKVSFADDVEINGQPLKAGTYSLYTIPGANEWTVIFNKNLELWGDTGYKQEEDALRVKVTPVTVPFPQETFSIDFENYTSNSADLVIRWDNALVKAPVKTEVDSKVMAQIDEKMQADSVSGTTYYSAARYYLENNKDQNKALEWINKAIQEREHFVFYNIKSKILAGQQKYKEAIKAAEKSKQLAKDSNNQDYVKISDELIARYKEKR